MWFTLALLSAAFAGLRGAREKVLLAQLDQFTIGWVFQLFSLPLLIATLLLTHKTLNPLHLGAAYWLPSLMVTLLFYPINTWLFYKALSMGELSKVLPIQSIMPALSMLMAFVVLREIPTALASAGISLIILGLYVINLNGLKLHNPFQPFLEDRSTLYMLGSTTSVALILPLDKIAINASNPLFYMVMSTIGGTTILCLIAMIASPQGPKNVSKNLRPLLAIGTSRGLAYATFIGALGLGPVAYVSSVRSSSALIGAVTGLVYLKEPVTWAKMTALILIGSGLSVLAFAK